MNPLRIVVLLTVSSVLAEAQTSFDAAQQLFAAKRYPEARVAFEKVVAAEQKNAAAWHSLGMVWEELDNDPKDTAPLQQALKALSQAVGLEPDNVVYLSDFGGASLDLARRATSLSAAIKGRESLEKAAALKPDYVPPHEMLYQFYTEAPWPLRSSGKAAVHLAAIRKVDPDRALTLAVDENTEARAFAAAFAACAEALRAHPSDYVALYLYGRTAAISGQNLEPGLTNLQKCLALTPPPHTTFGPAAVWTRIGNIQQKLNRRDVARESYRTALKFDPNNQLAARSLAELNNP